MQIAAMVVRTEKRSVSCRFASSPLDNIAVTAKYQPRRIDMRFISILTHNPTNRLPTEAEISRGSSVASAEFRSTDCFRLAATAMIPSCGRWRQKVQ
jgi:hypothetical protein